MYLLLWRTGGDKLLSILHPEVLPHIRQMPGGILPFRIQQTGRLLLVLKLTKEMILAAKLRQEIKFYIAPLPDLMRNPVPALITAFFDDEDEPLICVTPLCDDDLPRDLHEMLGAEELDLYFFDEHNREWLGYRAALEDGGSIFAEGGKFSLPPPSIEAGMTILQHANVWFALRTPDDDARSISATFIEPLFPEDFAILDTRPEVAASIGVSGPAYSTLVRENAGKFQERDIGQGLKRIFSAEQIALNPMRCDNGKELTDALVETETRVLVIQAKDSPNTSDSLKRTRERKLLASRAQVDEAAGQLKGATKYLLRNDPALLRIGSTPLNVSLGTREMTTIVVFKEAFLTDGDSYFKAWRSLEDSGLRALIIDYPAFDAFTHAFETEDRLMAGLDGFRLKVLGDGCYSNPLTYLFEITVDDRYKWAGLSKDAP